MTTIREALEVLKKAGNCDVETRRVRHNDYEHSYEIGVQVHISEDADLDRDINIDSEVESVCKKGFVENLIDALHVFHGSTIGYYIPEVKKIIYNGPATIVFWTDGTKTVVKMQLDEPKYDPDKAFAMAVCKKAFGNKFNKHLTQAQKAHLEACDKLFYENVKEYYPEFFDRLTDIAEVPKVPMKEY